MPPALWSNYAPPPNTKPRFAQKYTKLPTEQTGLSRLLQENGARVRCLGAGASSFMIKQRPSSLTKTRLVQDHSHRALLQEDGPRVRCLGAGDQTTPFLTNQNTPCTRNSPPNRRAYRAFGVYPNASRRVNPMVPVCVHAL